MCLTRCFLVIGVACVPARTAIAQSITTAPSSKSGDAKRPLSADARQFVSHSIFSYFAGTERVTDGVLSLAPPRDWSDGTLLPAADDHLGGTGYAGYAHSGLLKGDAWNLFELSALQDLSGGSVLGLSFRVDERAAATAIQAASTVTIPLQKRLFIEPTAEIGAGGDTAPVAGGAIVGRLLDDTALRDYRAGVDVSGWSYDRVRLLGKVGMMHRISRSVAVEGELAAGAWVGPLMGGDAALQVIVDALEDISARMGLYERATFARGAAYQASGALPDQGAYSVDLAVGLRWRITPAFGLVVAADAGGQPTYQRWGLQVTLYGKLF
jgi:hypothetical protein